MPQINKTVLMSGADFFSDADAINDLMDSHIPISIDQAKQEHQSIIDAFIQARIKVVKVPPPEGCQDGIYTANWALVRENRALLSRLPNKRRPEEAFAKKILEDQGLEVLELPGSIRAFSGQGDALACGDLVFCQSPYRTSADAHHYLKDLLGFKQVISLQTKPARWFKFGPSKTNKITGWPDSPTYDLDLALAVIHPGSENTKPLIAYCPAVFKKPSRQLLGDFNWADTIKVSRKETMNAFALNLVSTGQTVIMNIGAPKFKAQLVSRGLKTIELSLNELKKGGGSIRCSTLTLDG